MVSDDGVKVGLATEHYVVRGAIMATAFTVLILLSGLLIGVAAVSGSSGSVSVTHDMTGEEYADAFEESGTVTSEEHNTRVTVEEAADQRVRVHVDNPNSYAVDVDVRLDEEIVQPATLGDVRSVAGEDVEADWSTHVPIDGGADADRTTRVQMTVSGGEETTLAPSAPRVVGMAWAEDVTETSDSIRDRVSSVFDDDLEERELIVSPDQEDASTVTIDLTHNESEDVAVEDYLIQTKGPSDDRWAPITEDSNDPVYLAGEDGDTVSVEFNDRDHEVRFIGEPTNREKASHTVNGYLDGWDRLGDLVDGLPIGSVAPVGVGITGLAVVTPGVTRP